MSLIKFLFTPKKKMRQNKVPRIKLGKFTLSTHSMMRMGERGIGKREVIQHIYTKPMYNSKVRKEKDGSLSYNRLGRKITTSIKPSENLIKTMHRTGSRLVRKHTKQKKGKQ